jgi:hypothetical protein
MAEHIVKVKIPQRVEVLSKDLEVQVIRNGRRLGTLKISRGSLDWRDASDQFSHVLYWEHFAGLALEHGQRKKRK